MSGDGDDDTVSNIAPHEVNDKLAEFTLEGKWKMVVKMYKKFPEAHTVMISDSVGTALHEAVELNEEEVVEELVKAIITNEPGEEEQEGPQDMPMTMMMGPQKERKKPLEMENERGDTPLHVAASRGFAKLCKCIVGPKKERLHLVSLRNKQGETPLFVAALNWSKHAFAYLSDISRGTVTLADLVRNNGDSILHCAIKREYFDLAVIIVHYYDFLSTHINKEDFTPLKVLATRPSAFRSASMLSLWKLILYHCILVEPLDPESTMEKILKKMERPRPAKKKFPANYATLYDFFSNFSGVVALFGKLPWAKNQHDTENPQIRLEKYQGGFLPPNYITFQQFIKTAYVHSLGLSGVALKDVKKTKKKHQWSGQLLKALMARPYAAFTGSGGRPPDWNVDSDMYNVFHQITNQGENSNLEWLGEEPSSTPPLPVTDSRKGTPSRKDTEKETKPKDDEKDIDLKESPFLVAARNGIVEMVIEILSKIPSAIHNTNAKKENVLLVAVINRQPQVVETLRMKSKPEVWNNLILAADDDENTMLHLAAKAQGEEKPWQIAGSALQMMWDIKWFEYVKSIVPQHFFFRTNNKPETAGEIFKASHKELVKESSEWLKDTSESCSVVAALVAGVSFATASAVPGGTNDEGKPPLEGQPAFDAFAISSLVGLCFSVTGLIMFLAILTSRKEAKDFRRGLPLKLLLGLSSLFVSIVAMFVSFCSGHFFIINHKYKTFLFPFYAATSLPVAFYAVAQFPLYFDLLTGILTKVPRASDKG